MNNLSAQTNVTITQMSYITGGQIPNNGTIEIDSGGSSSIQFAVTVTSPNGNGYVTVYTKKGSQYPENEETAPEYVPSGFTHHLISKSITLHSHQFNSSGGTLYAEFEKNGLKYKSSTYSIVVNTASDPDSDGDGVPDSQDNCPNESGPVSNNGCPIATCNIGVPDNRSVNHITSNSANISWNSVTNASSYHTQYKKSTSGSFTNSSFSSSLSRNLSNLDPNTTYHWRVRAKCSNGAYDNWSTVESFTTLKECKDNETIYDDVDSQESEIIEVSNNIISFSKIKSGANVEYSAGNQISLSAFPTWIGGNFEVESGATFRAYIKGCSSTSSKTTTTSKKRIIEDESNTKTLNKADYLFTKEGLNIYPNPAKEFFKVASKKLIKSYILINPLNKVISNKKVDTSNFEVSIQNIPTGIYFLKVKFTDGKTVTKKIVKN